MLSEAVDTATAKLEAIRHGIVDTINPPFDQKRREMIKDAIIVGATAELLTLLPVAGLIPEASASTQARPWTSPRWWPIFTETAEKYNIPRLINVGGPLHEHDQQAWEVFGYVTKLRDEGVDWFNYVITNFPEMRDWAGYCPPLATAGILEPEPQAGAFSKETKEGLLVARHAANPYIPLTAEGLRIVLSRGMRAVIDAPTPGTPGRWFRAAYGINGNTLDVTAWAAGYIPIPFSHIVPDRGVYGWMPSAPGTPVDESVQQIQDALAAWKLNELNDEVVNYIVST